MNEYFANLLLVEISAKLYCLRVLTLIAASENKLVIAAAKAAL